MVKLGFTIKRNLATMVLKPEQGQSVELIFDRESLINLIANCRDAVCELAGEDATQLKVV